MIRIVPSHWKDVSETDFVAFLSQCNDYIRDAYSGSAVYRFRHNDKEFAMLQSGRIYVDPTLLKPMSEETQPLYRLRAVPAVRWFPGDVHPRLNLRCHGDYASLEDGFRLVVVKSGDWIIECGWKGPMIMDDKTFRATYECVTCPTTD